MSCIRMRGKKSTLHPDPADPPRRRANKRRGRGTYANVNREEFVVTNAGNFTRAAEQSQIVVRALERIGRGADIERRTSICAAWWQTTCGFSLASTSWTAALRTSTG